MSFFDLFRNFFSMGFYNEPGTNGSGNPDFHRESFRNPIWQSDEDDEIDDLWQGGPGMNFKIFSDPIQMSHVFESEINNVMKHVFGGTSINSMQNNPISTIPYEITKEDRELRHKMLKAGASLPAIANVPFQDKIDIDLDGRISSAEFSKMWTNGITDANDYPAQNNVSGKYIRREIICKADGTIEKKQIIRDLEGNEETIFARKKGDEAQVITIRKDKSGVQSKTEDLVNMDKNKEKDKDKVV